METTPETYQADIAIARIIERKQKHPNVNPVDCSLEIDPDQFDRLVEQLPAHGITVVKTYQWTATIKSTYTLTLSW